MYITSKIIHSCLLQQNLYMKNLLTEFAQLYKGRNSLFRNKSNRRTPGLMILPYIYISLWNLYLNIPFIQIQIFHNIFFLTAPGRYILNILLKLFNLRFILSFSKILFYKRTFLFKILSNKFHWYAGIVPLWRIHISLNYNLLIGITKILRSIEITLSSIHFHRITQIQVAK